jgi:murein DD-endopeptidase MepM/ murein hydrolase activator NlpD
VLWTLAAWACAQAASSGSQPCTLKGQWTQGSLILGRTDPRAAVWFNGRKLLVSPKGAFVFGIDRDQKGVAELRVAAPGKAEVVKRYPVRPRHWDIQRVDGLPQEKVTPPPEVEVRIEREQALLKAARAHDSEREDFAQAFAWPVHGRLSGVFGSQRILNGVPKQPHYGLDLAVPTGTRVSAPAGGIVRLAEPDLYFTGGTLIIDHGHGLYSVLVHLSRLLVKNGDEVQRGQAVAESGMTGRATGPHLHWGVYWFEAHIDPRGLVGSTP